LKRASPKLYTFVLSILSYLFTIERSYRPRLIYYHFYSKTIDQAPLNIKGNTLVPVRFVIEQLGGAIKWDPKEEKVSILRGNQLIDFWIGKKDFIMTGTAAASLAAPQIINGRTMVPLRVLSEKLGWTVTWNDKDKSIILE
jgi:hypothetical protein